MTDEMLLGEMLPELRKVSDERYHIEKDMIVS